MRTLVLNRIKELYMQFPVLPQCIGVSEKQLVNLSNIELLDLLEEIILGCYRV